MPTYVGADACRHGWCATVIDELGPRVKLFKSFERLSMRYSEANRILVDIPIGLPDGTRRTCDKEAKLVLGCRGGSVFFPPSVKSIDVLDFDRANEVHREHMEHGLSKQAHAIGIKIREVAEVVEDSYDGLIREAHPELCFAALNGQPVAYSKFSDRGLRMRKELLGKVIDEPESVYRDARDSYLLKQASRDDILDSMALAIGAASDSLMTLPDEPGEDEPRIYYPEVGNGLPPWALKE